MQSDSNQKKLHVPAKEIPIPRHLSPQAQAVLAMPVDERAAGYPDLEDTDGWRQHIAAVDEMLYDRMRGLEEGVVANVVTLREGNATAFDITPLGMSSQDRRVYLDIHGGGLIMGAGKVCRVMGIGTALYTRTRVVAVDYRMPPDHPYPVGLNDCLAFYRALLRDYSPDDIIVGGSSAGGNLAAALALRARDEGLPLPAGVVLVTPELDLTESGDSFQTNKGVDGVLRESLMQPNLLYAGNNALSHPYVSPLFGDFTKGFPPTFISVGTRDLFLSNGARMQRALRNAGIDTTVYLQEAAGHGGFGGVAPEDLEVHREIRLFCERTWNRYEPHPRDQ